MAKTITRRGFLNGLASIVLAGAVALPTYTQEPKPEIALKTPLQTLEKEDKGLVHSVLTRGNQQLYLIGEEHEAIDSRYKNYIRIINSEKIDCVFLEGLEGKINDKYIEKINKEFELLNKLIYDRKEKIASIQYPVVILFKESGEIIIPNFDFKDSSTNIPGAIITRLISPECKVDMYGIDNREYIQKCFAGLMKNSFEKAFEKLKEARKKEKENKDYYIFDNQNFIGNFDLKNYEIIIRNLTKRMEEFKKIAPWSIDTDETKKNLDFLQETFIKKRDEPAVREISRIMNQNPYKRGLVIRGESHINTMRRLLTQQGFTSPEYDPDQNAKDIDGDVYNLAIIKNRVGY